MSACHLINLTSLREETPSYLQAHILRLALHCPHTLPLTSVQSREIRNQDLSGKIRPSVLGQVQNQSCES